MDTIDAKQATLDALSGWASRRDQQSERADLLAAAWWAGNRNVAELARATGVSRQTIYSDLNSRGIDPAVRDVPAAERPRYAPLRHESVDELATRMEAVLLPPMLGEDPALLETSAWEMARAMKWVAELVKQGESAAGRDHGRLLAADTIALLNSPVEELLRALRSALWWAHAYAAGLRTEAELATFSAEAEHLRSFEECVVLDAALTVSVPNGEPTAVHVGMDGQRGRSTGWTTLTGENPRLRDDLNGKEHLALRTALRTIAEILTPRLGLDATASDE